LLPKIKLKKEKNLLEILDRRMYSSAMMKKIRVSCLHSFPYEQEAYKKLVDSHSPCYKVFVAPEDLRAAT